MLLNFNIQKILVKNSSQSITTSIFDGSLSQCMHCTDFGLTSILEKTKVPNNDIAYNHFNNYQLEMVDKFTYLWFTISINLSLDTEIDRRIGGAATTLDFHGTREWQKPMTHYQDQGVSV